MKRLFFVFVVCVAVVFLSCNGKSEIISPSMAAASGVVKSKNARNSAVYSDMAVSPYFEMAEEKSLSVDSNQIERKLIKNGYLSIEVENFDTAETDIKTFAKSFGGYITDTNQTEYNFSATVKIPAVNFEKAMDESGKIGKIKNKSENCQDVTEDFYDLDSRINSKRILKEKLESYLKQAKDMKELLEVERQLNQVVSELESMEGRMKRLNNQIDYSTININLTLPTGYNDSGFDWPDFGEDFKKLGVNTLKFLSGLLMFLIYLITFGIPGVIVFGFLYWLLIGKIGILKKLFRKLNGKN